jgi:hypothetical protein
MGGAVEEKEMEPRMTWQDRGRFNAFPCPFMNCGFTYSDKASCFISRKLELFTSTY